jgi:hypothetical protein
VEWSCSHSLEVVYDRQSTLHSTPPAAQSSVLTMRNREKCLLMDRRWVHRSLQWQS